jgi:hypothetical protein
MGPHAGQGIKIANIFLFHKQTPHPLRKARGLRASRRSCPDVAALNEWQSAAGRGLDLNAYTTAGRAQYRAVTGGVAFDGITLSPSKTVRWAMRNYRRLHVSVRVFMEIRAGS